MKQSAETLLDKDTQLLREVQNSFGGGMNLLQEDSNIGENEYGVCFNASSRYDNLKPFLSNTELAVYLTGKKQGIYNVANILILFVAGSAWYKLPDNTYQRISNFSMSKTAARYYVAFVPASTVNFSRYLSQATDSESVLVNPANQINKTPQALLVQDGEQQPWIIYLDGFNVSARRTQSYNEWSINYTPGLNYGREYVPIGTDMLWIEEVGMLVIVSADKKSFYRSVIGRPLDFVVNVTTTGDKGGDALTTNYAVSYSLIISIINSGSSQILIGTDSPATYLVQISFDQTIFGQPTFSRQVIMSDSAVNSFSVVDILGDTAFVAFNGIRSFNASKTLKIDSGNALFSKQISQAFENLLQDSNTAAAIVFNSYALFSLNTIYGNIIACFDTVRQKWDCFISAQNIKQFASLMPYSNQLYAITTDDKILQLFSGTDYAIGFVNTRRFAFEYPSMEQFTTSLVAVVKRQVLDGDITVSCYADNILAQSQTKGLTAGGVTTILPAPLIQEPNGKNTKRFEWGKATKVGYEIGYGISWSGGGQLAVLEHVGELTSPKLNQKESTTNVSS